MALPRYQGGQVSLGKSGVAMAHQAQANTIESFVQGIQGIKAGAIQQVADVSAQQAKMDAEQAFAQRGLQADINNDLTVYGKQYTQTLQGLHKKQLSIATGEQFKSFYEDNKDNPAKFEAESEAHYKATMKMLPPHLQADYAIDYEANKAMYAGKVKANRIAIDRDNDIATTNEIYNMTYDAGTQAAREGNQDVAVYNMVKGIDAIENSYDNKNISRVEADKKIAALKQGISHANFKGVNDGYIESGDLQGSQKYIDDFRGKTIDGFNDAERERLADQMQADLNNTIREQKTTAGASRTEDTAIAKELMFLQDNGQDVEIGRLEAALNSNISENTQKDLANSINDYNQLLLFNSLDLAGQADMINEIDNRENKTEDDFRLQGKMSKTFQNAQKLMQEDGLSFSVGRVIDDIEPVDFADKKSVDKRKKQVNKASEFTKSQQPFYIKNEITALKDSIPNMTPTEKTQLSKDINSLGEDIAGSTFSKLGGVFAMAGTHTDKIVSANIFKGEELLRAKIVTGDKKVRTSLSTTLREPLMLASPDNRAEITSAIEAWMAYKADKDGKTIADVDEEEAIAAVLGEPYTTGEYNPFVSNRDIIPPRPDVTYSEFLNWKDSITREDIGESRETMTLRELDIIKNGDFVWAGNGKYQVMIGANKAEYIDKDGKRQPYIIKYKDVK